MTETAASSPPRTYRYYDLLMAAFVTVLICSNMIGAGKVAMVGGFAFGAGVLFFPISYIFNDVLTEVYGYAKSRKVVWAGIGAMVFASLMSAFIVAIPPAPNWTQQAAFEAVFGQVPRIVFASLLAFWAGELTNSFVLAKMKLWQDGKHLWQRTIGSTVVGEAVDSLIFYPVAFLGVWAPELVLTVMVTNYLLKVLVEVVMTPVTYKIVNALKRAEHEDYYDRNTDFNPFKVAG